MSGNLEKETQSSPSDITTYIFLLKLLFTVWPVLILSLSVGLDQCLDAVFYGKDIDDINGAPEFPWCHCREDCQLLPYLQVDVEFVEGDESVG